MMNFLTSWHVVDSMTNLFWRDYELYDIMTYFCSSSWRGLDVMMNFLMSWRIFDIIINFFGIMTIRLLGHVCGSQVQWHINQQICSINRQCSCGHHTGSVGLGNKQLHQCTLLYTMTRRLNLRPLICPCA